MPKIVYNPVHKQKLQLYPNPGEDTIVDTKPNILAMTPTSGLVAYATDTEELLIGDGTTWQEHSHTASNITDFQTTVSANTDVSANTTHRGVVTGNPHAVTKTDVGLGNVPNLDTTDAINRAHDPATAGTGISITGQEVTNTDLGSTAVTNHVAEADPHTQYLQTTTAETTYLRLNASNSPVTGAITFQRTVSHIGTTNEVKQIVRAGTAQAASLTEWQSSSGTVLSGSDNTGRLFSHGGTSQQNVFIGEDSGRIATSEGNVAMGYRSLYFLTTGNNNTAIGIESAWSLTTGIRNFAMGYRAMFRNQTGGFNTAIGYQSLQGTPSNSHERNTAIGYRTLYTTTTGSNNLALGFTAGQNITGGSRNVLLGNAAGNNLGSGQNNVMIGMDAGLNATGSDNVFLGYRSGYNETGSSKLYIGNSFSSDPLIYGEFDTGTLGFNANVGISTTSPTAKLHIAAGSATAGTAPLKLTAGTNLTTPESGVFEFDGTDLFFTVGGVRKTVTLT